MVPAFERRLVDQHHQEQQGEAVDGEGTVTLAAVCDGFRAGSVTPFHVSHFPAGHSPTDYDRCLPYEPIP